MRKSSREYREQLIVNRQDRRVSNNRTGILGTFPSYSALAGQIISGLYQQPKLIGRLYQQSIEAAILSRQLMLAKKDYPAIRNVQVAPGLHSAIDRDGSYIYDPDYIEPTISGKLPTIRQIASPDILDITEYLYLSIGQVAEDFQIGYLSDYSYQVSLRGQQVELNSNCQFISYQGETVLGVPEILGNVRNLGSTRLLRILAKWSSYVTDTAKPKSPEWLARYSSLDSRLIRNKVGKSGWGECQLHHVDQWYDGMVKVVNSYNVIPLAKADRFYVVLPKVCHDFTNRDFYDANHPTYCHPETGKQFRIGIGVDLRREHAKFTSDFWREYYRHFCYQIIAELNRRLSKKLLTIDYVQVVWNTELAKLADGQRYVIILREEREKQIAERIRQQKIAQRIDKIRMRDAR